MSSYTPQAHLPLPVARWSAWAQRQGLTASCRNTQTRSSAGRPDVKTDEQTIEVRDVGELQAARHDLGLFLQRLPLASGASYDLLTCVQEAAKNALRFAQSPDGVRIVATASQSEVVISVRDHGTGLDLARLDDRMPDPLCESGRGLSLLVALMDKVEFRIERGTEVRLHKALRPRSRPRDHAA